MPYASPQQLVTFAGANRLELRVAGQETEKLAALSMFLSGASGQMNEAFERAGYAVPIDPSLAGGRADEVSNMLTVCCCAVALGDQSVQPTGDDGSVSAASSKWLSWLDDVANGRRLITGIPKAAQEIEDRSQGRVGFVASGEVSQPPQRHFDIAIAGLVF